MAQDWDIRPLADSCGACGRAFADQEAFSSTLIYGKEGYVRTDYCNPCWSDPRRENPDSAPFSAWQGVFKAPPPKPEEALKKETAESLLRRLMEENNPAHRNVIYILAVMLERKRLFVERDVQDHADGTKVLVYEHRHTGETFLIPDPRLRLNELESVQEEVVIMLGGTPPGKQDTPADEGESPETKAASEGEANEDEDGEEEDDEDEDEDDDE